MSADRKYTDRDVRDNPDYGPMVVEYLSNYTGEFDFLVDCKMRVAQNVGLTVGMIRGVLNCMRNDPRVKTQMPDPIPEQPGEVLDLKEHKRRKRESYCINPEVHEPHDDEGLWPCRGVHALNRTAFELPATLKRPYAMGKTGQLIHSVVSGTIFWVPADPHGFGYTEETWNNRSSGQLLVKTHCKTVIRSALLLRELDAVTLVKTRKYLDNWFFHRDGKVPVPSQRKPLSWCTRCETMKPLNMKPLA